MRKRLKDKIKTVSKNIHTYQLAMLLLVSLAIAVAVQPQTKSNSEQNNEVQIVAANPSNQEFSTVVVPQTVKEKKATVNKTTSAGQAQLEVGDKKTNPSTHNSDILKRLGDVPQEEYVAFLEPNDPTYPLWYLDSIGLPDAWDRTTGSTQTVIAVIDSGYALNHVELSDRWFINSGESGLTVTGDACWTGTPTSKQSNNCDDDGNGYIDDWRGWDFNSFDNSPQAGSTNPTGDGVTHGTLVAGIIAANGNNAAGFPGVDWQTKIMPLQALSDDGTGYTSDIVAAVEYAVDNGADIINLSLGGPSYNYAFYLAASYARANDVLLIASSGNCATLAYTFCSQLEAPGYMGYPALYEEVVSVGAVTAANNRASFSSYHTSLDVVAPGQSLTTSTSWSNSNQTNLYASGISGTSFSAPLVSGVASLLMAANDSLSAAEIRQILVETAQQNSTTTGDFDDEYGFGIINARRALAYATSNEQTNTLRTNRNSPTASSDKGQNPASPLATNEDVTTTLTSYSGDEISLTAYNQASDTEIMLGSFKTDQNGQATFTWNASTLGDGIWQLIPSGRLLSGLAETVYIGN